jgi:hypothetical protein
MVALLNQKAGTRQGQVNVTLYAMAAQESLANCNGSNTSTLPAQTCVFNDVTIGTNAVPGETGYNTSSETYMAGVGYDLATGLGSVNAAALVNGWTGPKVSSVQTSAVSPSSGSGGSQVFTFTFTNSAGGINYKQAQVLIRSSLSGQNACWLIYDVPSGAMYIRSDDGTQTSAPVTPGSSGVLSNSQCSVPGSGISLSQFGTHWVLNVGINFTQSFTGAQNIFAYTFDGSWNGSGWSQIGSWLVGSGSGVNVTSVSPAGGTGLSQNFTFTFVNQTGGSNFNQAQMLFRSSLSGQNACWLMYDVPSGGMYIFGDNGTQLTGPVAPGSGAVLTNSQCSVPASGISVQTFGKKWIINVGISFLPTFAGTQNVYAYSIDNTSTGSGWAQIGSWTVP